VTPTLVALVPVLARPQNIGPLVASFEASLAGENVEASMLFLVNPEDAGEIAELAARGLWHEIVPWPNSPRDYTRKMNRGIRTTSSDWILLAADDLSFHPGWFRAALNAHIRTGCLVVGTNDMVNPLVKAGKHATHPLLHRNYVPFGTIDNPNEVLHHAYMHNSVDVEFCETAISRGQFVAAPDSLVEHRHPTFDRSIKRDLTYQKGMRYAGHDRHLFLSRRRMWNPTAAWPLAKETPGATRPRVRPIGNWPRR
jgi:hypothetical protein